MLKADISLHVSAVRRQTVSITGPSVMAWKVLGSHLGTGNVFLKVQWVGGACWIMLKADISLHVSAVRRQTVSITGLDVIGYRLEGTGFASRYW